MTPRVSRRRGYTAVELLMAISIFAIGVSGIIAMQKVTVGANKHARDLAIATHIAQAWLEQLSADAAAWNHPSAQNTASDLNQTTWLQQVGADWVRPAYSATREFGAGFDALGNPVSDVNAGDAVFCSHIRMTWLYTEASGNGLIRTEVRVFWLRDGQGAPIGNQPICAPATAVAAVSGVGVKYHFVHAASAAKQNTAP